VLFGGGTAEIKKHHKTPEDFLLFLVFALAQFLAARWFKV
jgi:hypothetical protein